MTQSQALANARARTHFEDLHGDLESDECCRGGSSRYCGGRACKKELHHEVIGASGRVGFA